MKTKTVPAKALWVVQKATDLGEGLLEAVVATEDKDREQERLSLSGLSIAAFKKNPVVLWAHQYDKPPIGKAESITKKADGTLVAKIKFAITESTFAKEIYALYKGGFLNAFSIGFIPEQMDDDNTFSKSEMLEFSAVPVPANPNALATAKTKGIASEDTINKLKVKDDEEKPEDSGESEDDDSDDSSEETPEQTQEETKEETKTVSEIKVTMDNEGIKEIKLAAVILRKAAEKMAKELEEYKKLDRAGASPRKKRIRLVKVKQAAGLSQRVAQETCNLRTLKKLKGRSIRKIRVKAK